MWKARSAFSVLAALSLAATGCGALDDFEVELSDEATIDGTWMAGPAGLDLTGFDDMKLESSQEFGDQGVDPSDVDAILIKSVRVEGTDPEKDRLDVILSSLELFVEAPGQPRRRVANISDFPAPSRAIDLVVDDPAFNLKPYATASSMTMSAEVGIKKAPLFSTTLRTTVILLVDINLLGV